MPCLPEEKKSIPPNLCLFLWIRRTSGHSWGPKHLEQGGESKHHSLEGTDQADVYGLCKQEVVDGLFRPIGGKPVLLTISIEKTSDEFIE
jgi:hypothetical protein